VASVSAEDAPPEALGGPGGSSAARRYGVLVGVAAAVVLADQLTKWWALETLADGRIIDLVWTLRLRLVFNTGSAFSVGSGAGPFIGIVALVIVVGLMVFSRRVHDVRLLALLGVIGGGALGNLADRAFRDGDGVLGGAVVDFVDLQWWPVFNVADAALWVGIGVLLLASRQESVAP
jgi:signal peptidase II